MNHDAPAVQSSSLASTASTSAVHPVPALIEGHTYRKETPAGTARVVINAVDADPFEVFLLLGRAGSEVQSFMEALGRVISLYLRSDAALTPRRKLELVAEQLQGIGGANQMGFGPSRVLSVVDGIGQLLAAHLQNDSASPPSATPAVSRVPASSSSPVRITHASAPSSVDLCPQCNAATLVFEEGCRHCSACGYSKC